MHNIFSAIGIGNEILDATSLDEAKKLLPSAFVIIYYARTPLEAKSFLDDLRETRKLEGKVIIVASHSDTGIDMLKKAGVRADGFMIRPKTDLHVGPERLMEALQIGRGKLYFIPDSEMSER